MKTPPKQTFRFRKSKKKEHLLNPVLCYRFPIFKKKMKSICSQAVFYKRTLIVNIYSLIEWFFSHKMTYDNNYEFAVINLTHFRLQYVENNRFF